MTIQQLFNLDSIKQVSDLVWRRESYCEGDPRCICSACGQNILDTEETEEIAIRLWSKSGQNTFEAVIHPDCFSMLLNRGIVSLKNNDND